MEDESKYINWKFRADETEFIDLKFLETNPSPWNAFPDEFQFISVQLYVSDVKQIISRETYDFLMWMGDLGGLMDFLNFVGMTLFSVFSRNKMFAILTNRFYT